MNAAAETGAAGARNPDAAAVPAAVPDGTGTSPTARDEPHMVAAAARHRPGAGANMPPEGPMARPDPVAADGGIRAAAVV